MRASHLVLVALSAPFISASTTPRDTCAFDSSARVTDACATYDYLDDINSRISEYVSAVVRKTDFFSYYRLNLYNKACPFWSDSDGLCGNIACAVTTLENEDDVPLVWRAAELSKLEGPKAHHPDARERAAFPERPLHGDLGEGVGESCVVEYDDECDQRDYCVPEDEGVSAKGDYVSLVDNPERFTGYAGQAARQVWDAIYRENCFSRPQERGEQVSGRSLFGGPGLLAGGPAQAALREVMKDHGRQQAIQTGGLDDGMEFDDECVEKRIFYRVISGMHASISTHLCYDHLNQTTGEWGPNVECYKQRLHDRPERISNLYFNYAVVLRAVSKLRDYIGRYTFCSGDAREDARTKTLVRILAGALPAGPELFDESILFRDGPTAGDGIALKEDFRSRFRNVSRIMDCVGCDKCRLWGKVQTAGYGTALKVLFELGIGQDEDSQPLLRRTELVALMNTLDKIGQAISAINYFEDALAAESGGGEEGDELEELEDVPPPPPPVHETEPEASPPDPEEEVVESAEAVAKKDKQRGQPRTFTDDLKAEFHVVLKAYKIVFGGWLSLPSTLFRIILDEAWRFWFSYLGYDVSPRNWRFRLPELEREL